MGVERWLLLWFGATAVTLADKNLKQCNDKERLYHVAITDNHGSFLCGGSLISDSWILTDAYCYQWGMKIILGGHPGPGRTFVIDHPPEILIDGNREATLMLLKLPHPTKIKPVKLPTQQLNLTNEIVDLAGYGIVTTDKNNQTDLRESVKLQCVKIKVSNSQKFEKKLWFYKSTDDTVDISWRDSGGAMIYKDMIYGVMIYFGLTLQRHTAPYLDVFDSLGWINRIINQ